MSTETLPKTRKPRARAKEIVLGAIEERLSALAEEVAESPHVARLFTLMDELKRSLNGKESDAE